MKNKRMMIKALKVEIMKVNEIDEGFESEDYEEYEDDDEEYEDDDQNKSLLWLRKTLRFTLKGCWILLWFSQIVYLYHKLKEEKLNSGNWTSELAQKVEDVKLIDDVSSKAVMSTLLVSAIPLLFMLLTDPVENLFKSFCEHSICLGFVRGCIFGCYLTVNFEILSISFIRMYKTDSVCAQESCSQIETKILRLYCFEMHRNVKELQEYLLEENFFFNFDQQDSCPSIKSVALFLILAIFTIYAFLYSPKLLNPLVKKYQLRVNEDGTDSNFKLSIVQDFSLSFLDGFAIGINYLFNNSAGTLTCLFVVLYKLNYQIRDFLALRFTGCSNTKVLF